MFITTSADALAKGAYNALLYCPKTQPWDMCLVIVDVDRVSYLTTDGYALAWASHSSVTSDELVPGVALKVSRDSLVALEERARKGKKEAVSLEVDLGEHVICYRGEDAEDDLYLDDIFEDGIEDTSWDEINLSMFRELIAERAFDPSTRQVMVAPKYLRKLGQLKKNDTNQGADFSFDGEAPEDGLVLIAVGEDFALMIQPIDRERHRAALGEGATW